jgi:hypothetical protein
MGNSIEGKWGWTASDLCPGLAVAENKKAKLCSPTNINLTTAITS